MGMFDNVRCEAPLPGIGDATGWDFQTKDTPSQFLDTYIIREDGSVWIRDPQVEIVPEDERDDMGLPLFRRVGGLQPVDWTGEVYFYGTPPGSDWSGEWHEFKAVIVRGRVDGPIERVPNRYGNEEDTP